MLSCAVGVQDELEHAIGMTAISLSGRLRNETELTSSQIVATAADFGVQPG